MKAEKRSFSINARGQIGNTWQLIAQFDTIFGCKIVTLRSAVQVMPRVHIRQLTHLIY